MNSKTWFQIGGIISFAIALLHLVVIFIGADAYRYFGAGEEMALMAEEGSYYPATITTGIILVFILFGLYAFSAVGTLRKLPGLKTMLSLITGIYVLRGLGFFVETLGIIYNYDVPVRHAVFSFVAFVTGIIHLIGLIRIWKKL